MNFNGMKITCKSCGRKLILVELGQSFGGNKEPEDAYCCHCDKIAFHTELSDCPLKTIPDTDEK